MATTDERGDCRPQLPARFAAGRPRRAVLVVQSTVPSSLAAFFRGQLSWLAEREFDVHAIASPGAELAWVGEWDGVRTHGVKMTRSVSALGDILSVLSLARLYRRCGVDIVHSFSPKAGLLGMLAARLARCRVKAFTIWGLPDPSVVNTRWRLMRGADRGSSAVADRVYVECDSIGRLVVSESICSPKKLKVLPAWSANSLTREFLRTDDVGVLREHVRTSLGLPNDALVLGFVGRIVGDKGVNELVESFVGLSAAYPKLFLLMVGRRESADPIRPVTTAIIDSHTRIRAVGFQREVRGFLCAMDVLAHPSYREGLPSAPLEGAAQGLPVIATRIPGCVDAVLHEKTGWLVEPRDAVALGNGIAMYLRSPALRFEHGREGRARIEREFDLEGIWDALRLDYRALLMGEQGARPM